MNLRIVILKAKQRADGSNKIRIAVSHNSTTRYIPTRFVVDGERNLRNGVVVNMANAAYINQQLRTQLNKIYTIFDSLEDRDAYTCSQLIKVIKGSYFIRKGLTIFYPKGSIALVTRGQSHVAFPGGIRRFWLQ